MRSSFLGLALVLSGCASVPVQKNLELGQGVILSLPQPKEIMPELKAVQTLTVRHAQSSRTFQTVLENKENRLSLAVVTPFWPTPLHASYDGKQFKIDRSLQSNMPFDFQYVLADIIVVYARERQLRQWLNNKTVLTETEHKRSVTSFDGTPVIDVRYQMVKDPWLGDIRLENHLRKYVIEIKTDRIQNL